MPNAPKNSWFHRYVESGLYEIFGIELATCDVCNAESVECEIYTHGSDIKAICLKCCGIDESHMDE